MPLSLLYAAALAATALAVDPTVQLPYATYEGVQNGDITSWIGMRYAAPPPGDLRFAAPQPPPKLEGVQPADKHGYVCRGVGHGLNPGEDEDCLFVDVYAPSNATTESKLPVFFWIQGGGFTQDSVPNVNGTDLIRSTGNSFITVFLNYRVGAYGFLGGKQFGNQVSGTSLNNGIKDQIAALAWVQENIASFGGDPGHVALGGSSAGGGSQTELLVAYGGANQTLNCMFHAIAAESPFHPALFTEDTSQFQYDAIVNTSKCGMASDEATIACLRGLSAAQLQSVNLFYTLPGGNAPPVFEYGPTIGDELFPDTPYALLQSGKFHQVPTIWGDDYNGGTIFVPKGTATQREMNTFLLNQYPTLTADDLTRINQLYTPTNVPAVAPPNNTSFGAYYNTVAKVFGDMTFQCAAFLGASSLSSTGQQAWQYEFNATTAGERADGTGAAHVTEQAALFGAASIGGGEEFDPALIAVFRAYWASFIRSYDPNACLPADTPAWEQWSAEDPKWLVFGDAQGAPAAAPDAPDGLQLERCKFLESIGALLGQ